ncbi:MAG: zinc-dependent metalloprotease family protein [Methylovulum sp.]|uniref:zinc-dependent metalloprotease family protein n=1 Tax=Methylovulum sp. TaxID=1916980 RepID=UPI0026371FE1|nr:zinc-dependent metalloprotease family protein [Methylovulum sp.]MDD2724676.1 zinc-dependent metalloprotease family protein [Methylovulum sp.]MDD5125884.1 zinc-dependent metalloprotease family protein [Methylovulum sp.]
MSTHDKSRIKLFSVVAIALLPLAAAAQNVRHFGLGMPAPLQLSDLPTSNLRTKLDMLPAKAQQKALESLRKLSFTEQDLQYLQVDNNGGVLFVDSFLPPAPPVAGANSQIEKPALISASDAFSLHSRPGAKKIIYLDFTGMDITGTAWNDQANVPTFNAQAYDTNGSPDTFSSDELNSIADIWHRVAEDYMPFNVDVTTKEPKIFGPTVGRILITKNVDKNGVAMPYSNAGGVAYVGVWGQSYYTTYSPALVYFNNLGTGQSHYVAEAASHEMGHNLGLSHDGTSSVGYYAGLGSGVISWAPIMGVGYYTNITQWSKGEYPDANQKEDDIAIIKANLGYRADDHGNTLDTATPLVIDGSGKISATNVETDPHNADKSNKGVIGKLNDADYFSFYVGAGPVNITVTPAWDAFYNSVHRGANLDVQATLYRWDGGVLQKSDPSTETKAVISKTLAAGQYFLAIRGVGNTVTPYSKYDSLGQYFIRGTVTP